MQCIFTHRLTHPFDGPRQTQAGPKVFEAVTTVIERHLDIADDRQPCIRHLVAWIRLESSRIRHLWRLTDSEVPSLFRGLAYPCNKVAENLGNSDSSD